MLQVGGAGLGWGGVEGDGCQGFDLGVLKRGGGLGLGSLVIRNLVGGNLCMGVREGRGQGELCRKPSSPFTSA